MEFPFFSMFMLLFVAVIAEKNKKISVTEHTGLKIKFLSADLLPESIKNGFQFLVTDELLQAAAAAVKTTYDSSKDKCAPMAKYEITYEDEDTREVNLRRCVFVEVNFYLEKIQEKKQKYVAYPVGCEDES